MNGMDRTRVLEAVVTCDRADFAMTARRWDPEGIALSLDDQRRHRYGIELRHPARRAFVAAAGVAAERRDGAPRRRRFERRCDRQLGHRASGRRRPAAARPALGRLAVRRRRSTPRRATVPGAVNADPQRGRADRRARRSAARKVLLPWPRPSPARPRLRPAPWPRTRAAGFPARSCQARGPKLSPAKQTRS
jgi:hypothetical protein